MVIAMPSPPPDRRVLVNPMPSQNVLGNEQFEIVTYNLLASIYATQVQYPCCLHGRCRGTFVADPARAAG